MDTGLMIDWETADRITITTLQEAKRTIQEDLDNHYENVRSMHLDDVAMYEGIITAINVLLEYYGEL